MGFGVYTYEELQSEKVNMTKKEKLSLLLPDLSFKELAKLELIQLKYLSVYKEEISDSQIIKCIGKESKRVHNKGVAYVIQKQLRTLYELVGGEKEDLIKVIQYVS